MCTVKFSVVKIPQVFTHAEYADMIVVYGFSDGNIRLGERGTLPSVNFVSERPVQQTLNEVANILQAVERSPTLALEELLLNLIFHKHE